MLEASWDADTMGQVPSDPAIAANEAFTSILSAADKGVRVFFIDLLLPAYDVTQGSNLYDEVLAVEYCIQLAGCFSGKSSILVRDDKTVQTVQRILDRREESRLLEASTSEETLSITLNEDVEESDEEYEDDDESEEDDAVDDEESVTPSISGKDSADPPADVDLFRQQLMASWQSEDNDSTATRQGDKALPKPDEQAKPEVVPTQPSIALPEKRYRLASLFGNARISQGPDMMEDVVQALRDNALPQDDEENLIILSAIEREEMVAVRSLATKYSNQKNIVLVNCKLNPIPRELYGAETVYSILPLIARPSGADSQAIVKDKKSTPKIVVLRRYPGDWQVFVDVGRGFQLAKTAPSDLSNKRGPPMKWIEQAVQSFMQSQ